MRLPASYYAIRLYFGGVVGLLVAAVAIGLVINAWIYLDKLPKQLERIADVLESWKRP